MATWSASEWRGSAGPKFALNGRLAVSQKQCGDRRRRLRPHSTPSGKPHLSDVQTSRSTLDSGSATEAPEMG